MDIEIKQDAAHEEDEKISLNVLVSGGAGYIGLQTAKELSVKGYNVVVLDRKPQKNVINTSYGKYVSGDIGDGKLVSDLIKKHSIDAVIDFAAFINVSESVSDPGKYYENNVVKGKKFLDAAVDSGVDKFIFSSSCATYGIPEKIPIDESEKQSPINPYGWTKLFFERMLKDYGEAYGLKSVSLRYFNAAGADADKEMGEMHEPETHVIPILLETASGIRKSFSVFGTDYDTPDGTCIRDYVHVMDLADAHVLALEYLINGGATDAFNLGAGHGTSVLELIRIVENITETDLPLEKKGRRPGDPPVLVADNRRARKILKWVPENSSVENIVKTAWEWHKKYRC